MPPPSAPPPDTAPDPDADPPLLEEQGLEALVRWATNLPLRRRWEPERVRQRFCRRSAEEVRAEGDLDYASPCADLCSLLAPELSTQGLPVTLVLTGIRRPLQAIKFQCGLEVEHEGATWVVGFALYTTWLYQGQFVETRRRPWIWRQPLEPGQADPSQSFLEHFDPRGLERLEERIPAYRLEPHRRLHVRSQNPLEYAWTRWRARRAAQRAPKPGRLADGSGRWA